jgi:hypothetical protein
MKPETRRDTALVCLSMMALLACDAVESRSPADAVDAADAGPVADAALDAGPDAALNPDAGAGGAPAPVESPLVAALRANGGPLAYDLTVTFDDPEAFFPGTPVTARLVLDARSGHPETPIALTVFAPGVCNRAATNRAFAEPYGLSFAHDLAISFGDLGAETVTLLAGALRVGEPEGVLVGEARVERYIWQCDTEEIVETSVTLRAVPEHTPPVAQVALQGALPPFPRYVVGLDELLSLGGPSRLLADGAEFETATAGSTAPSFCGPEPRRSAAALPWGAQVQVSVPELTDRGGAAAPAQDLPLGRVVSAPTAPFAPSFEAEDLAGFAIVGPVELLGAESSLPADDGVRRVRAAGLSPWALAFEIDVPADPVARLDFSVRTLMGDKVYGTDTSTAPSPATLSVRIGAGDTGTAETFALPVPAFDTPTSEAVALSVPLGDFAGQRVVLQFDAADTCPEDACGGHTCTDVLLDGLAVRP